MFGLSVTRLPYVVVEEEISHLPMIISNFRVGLPYNFSFSAQFNTNYFTNFGSGGLNWSIINNRFSFNLGGRICIWHGQMDLDNINLRAWGLIFNPNIALGYDFKKFLFSLELEAQYSKFSTYTDGVFIGTIDEPKSGFAFKINIEQPLWNDHWIDLSLKLNYTRFYYQSWLTFSTIKEFLFYPEFTIGFIL